MQAGLVWSTKIITDPVHDIYIYRSAPLHLLRGEMYDEMTDWYRPEQAALLEPEPEPEPQS
jgi:hypothetical protein